MVSGLVQEEAEQLLYQLPLPTRHWGVLSILMLLGTMEAGRMLFMQHPGLKAAWVYCLFHPWFLQHAHTPAGSRSMWWYPANHLLIEAIIL